MTVHDVAGAQVMQKLGLNVWCSPARTRSRTSAPFVKPYPISLETFVHGALCISYSGSVSCRG